jgi:hypothetical protein
MHKLNRTFFGEVERRTAMQANNESKNLIPDKRGRERK